MSPVPFREFKSSFPPSSRKYIPCLFLKQHLLGQPATPKTVIHFEGSTVPCRSKSLNSFLLCANFLNVRKLDHNTDFLISSLNRNTIHDSNYRFSILFKQTEKDGIFNFILLWLWGTQVYI